MKVQSRQKSSIKKDAVLNVRYQFFKIEAIYDYEADTTELIMPDKLRFLPKIHLLDFLKDLSDLVQAERYKTLEEYNKEGKDAT